MKRISDSSLLQKEYCSNSQSIFISWAKNGQGTPEETLVVLGSPCCRSGSESISEALSREY